MTELETEYTAIDVICPNCLAQWEAPFARFANAGTHPDARLGALLGTMHRSRCPACHTPKELEIIFDYYDPAQQLIVQVRPAWEFQAGGGEEWYWARYEDLVEKYQDIDVRVDVVFGIPELVEKYLGGEAAVAAAKEEWAARKAANSATASATASAAEAESEPAAESADPAAEPEAEPAGEKA